MLSREVLEETIRQAKRSHKWMLETISHEGGNKDPTEHSDEVKHAVSVQKLLEMVE